MVKPGTTSSSSRQTTSAPERSSDAKYKGVRKRKWGKWVSEVRLPNSRERIWLGSYDTPEKAARAFDAAQFCLRGNTAKFNFPDQSPDIPGGRSMSPAEIQTAAARFANSIDSNTNINNPRNCTATEDNSSSWNSSQESPSPSPSLSDGAVQMDQGDTWTSQLDSTSPFRMNLDSNNSVQDFGIYPGFDDYFMPSQLPPPPEIDDGEENCDGFFMQGPSFLWNF